MSSRWSAVSISPIRASPMDAHLAGGNRGLVFGAASVDELPVIRPEAGVTQKIDHDARIAGARRFEDHRYRTVVLSQLIFRQAPTAKDRLGFSPVQLLDKLLVVRLVSANDPADPDPRVFAGRCLRRHSPRVPQLPHGEGPRFPEPGTPGMWPGPRR